MTKAVHFVRRVWDNPANRGRRLRQLAHAVRFQTTSRRGHRFITPLGEHSWVLASRQFEASALAVYANPPDVAEVRVWRRLLKPRDLFVDVGANIGTYSVLMCELGCRVIAVEPDPVAADQLSVNLRLNGYQAEIVRAALGASAGEVRFSSGMGSTNHITRQGDRVVPSFTLDALLDGRIAAGVKIDVEGAERLVLEGARSALRDQRVRVFQLEWNDTSQRNFGETREAVKALLLDSGYRTFRPSLNGALVPDARLEYGSDVFAVSSTD